MVNTRKKVLLVEDDDALRQILADKLTLGNYQILEASDGEEAINLIIDKKPNLVLLDLLLPKLDGFKVLERVRHYPDAGIANISVVVLSNLWSNKDILRAQALRIDEYYVKANTNLDDVCSKISEIINQPK